MSGCYGSCLSNPEPSFPWHSMSDCYMTFLPYPDLHSFVLCFDFIGIILCAYWIYWHILFSFKPPMSYQQDSSSNHHLSYHLSSTNNHNLTTFLMSSVVNKTFVHYHVFCKILTPIGVHCFTLICYCTPESLPKLKMK